MIPEPCQPIALHAHIKRLLVPILGDSALRSLETVGIASRRTSVGVYIRRQTGSHTRIADEEHTLDCLELISLQLGHGIHGCSRSLRVTLEQEAS